MPSNVTHHQALKPACENLCGPHYLQYADTKNSITRENLKYINSNIDDDDDDNSTFSSGGNNSNDDYNSSNENSTKNSNNERHASRFFYNLLSFLSFERFEFAILQSHGRQAMNE